jgi:hypothetical protein
MNLTTIRFRAALVTLLMTPWLVAANGKGCGGDAPIGGDDPPDGVACGSATCGQGEYCCNEGCGICAPEGGACDAKLCLPPSEPCGNTTCGAGEYCCNPSCSVCAPAGGACDAKLCLPPGEPCGNTTCGAGEYCCNPSCSVCAPAGGACDAKLCLPPGDVQCTGDTSNSKFPSFDNSCTSPAACVIKFHQINCCGTRIALGISASASAAFDQAEAACEAMYPGCGCAALPTKAEDGKAVEDTSMIKVDCKAGTCQTFVP